MKTYQIQIDLKDLARLKDILDNERWQNAHDASEAHYEVGEWHQARAYQVQRILHAVNRMTEVLPEKKVDGS